jgi:hypothetical protein
MVREEHGKRVFKNRVLKRIPGPNRIKISGGRRKLHNDQLHSLYSSPNIIHSLMELSPS